MRCAGQQAVAGLAETARVRLVALVGIGVGLLILALLKANGRARAPSTVTIEKQEEALDIQNITASLRQVINEFGFNDYGSISGMAELIKFMHRIAGTANKYSNELIAVFYTASDILGLSNLHNELVLAQNEQESYKSERMRLTDVRDTLLNSLYTYITYTIKVGKIIYEDNRAMYARYLLPTTNASNLPTLRIASQAREIVVSNVHRLLGYL